jgi:uncharacterized protein (DUF488 family)
MEGKAWTAGYEGLTVQGLLDALALEQIEVLVDVRERPLSRKPGFSKAALAKSTEEAGLEYVHVRELGSPAEARAAYRKDADFAELRRRYLAHLKGEPEAIARLLELMGARRCALMCYERDEGLCHRGILCAQLEPDGWTFVHLRPALPRKPARSSGAKLSDFQ